MLSALLKKREEKKAICGALLFACSAAIEKVTTVSPSLQCCRRCREKSMHKKALHSCSISSFTASTIKTGFYGLSIPNFPLSWRWPVQSHQHCTEAKRLLLGLLWHQISDVHADYMEGRVIDNYTVAIHCTGMHTLLAMMDSAWQETTSPSKGKWWWHF